METPAPLRSTVASLPSTPWLVSLGSPPLHCHRADPGERKRWRWAPPHRREIQRSGHLPPQRLRASGSALPPPWCGGRIRRDGGLRRQTAWRASSPSLTNDDGRGVPPPSSSTLTGRWAVSLVQWWPAYRLCWLTVYFFFFRFFCCECQSEAHDKARPPCRHEPSLSVNFSLSCAIRNAQQRFLTMRAGEGA